jgi:nicotinamidase-related amidase
LLLDKTHGDAFQDTELDALLRAKSIDTVYVTGLVTEGCVRATCLGALKRGYHVVLVADAHSSFHRDAASRIRYWNEKLAEQLDAVVPASEVDFAIAKTRKHKSPNNRLQTIGAEAAPQPDP